MGTRAERSGKLSTRPMGRFIAPVVDVPLAPGRGRALELAVVHDAVLVGFGGRGWRASFYNEFVRLYSIQGEVPSKRNEPAVAARATAARTIADSFILVGWMDTSGTAKTFSRQAGSRGFIPTVAGRWPLLAGKAGAAAEVLRQARAQSAFQR